MVATLLATAALLSPGAQARPQPRPQARPPAKTAPSQSQGPVVLGTRQLPGDFGKIGTTYTIGQRVPLNFTLVSAEYRLDRYVGDDGYGTFGYLPRKEEKLLILRYTVQNPNRSDARLWYATFNIIGITGDDRNLNHIGRPLVGNDKRYRDIQLKPAQKVSLTTVMRVPADGELPKLMIQVRAEPNAAVIRYDLRGKVAKLPAELADDGFTPKPMLAGALDTWFQWPGYDVKVVSFAPQDPPLASVRTARGQRQWVARLAIRRVADKPSRFWHGAITLAIRTADGDTFTPRVVSRLIRMSTEDPFDGAPGLGEEMNLRLVVDLAENLTPQELRLTYRNPGEEFRPVAIPLPASP